MTETNLQREMESISWYHSIPIKGTTLITPGHNDPLKPQWDWSTSILEGLHKDGLLDGPALDVACRDGLFSFWLEDHGITPVTGIDNNISEGIGWIARVNQSKIQVKELSVYDLPPSASFETVLFFGVLYHLRYPFNGIKAVVGATKVGGVIVIETGMLLQDDLPLVYCPVLTSPWDATSCTFFNAKGLNETMESFGCRKIKGPWFHGLSGHVDRGILVYLKEKEFSSEYWNGIHRDYTEKKESRSGDVIREITAKLHETV